MTSYTALYRRSLEDPAGFWAEAAQDIEWDVAPSTVVDCDDVASPHWFADGRLNTCYNALDRHVSDGRGDQVALIWDSPVTGVIRRYTYAQLLDEVSRFAGVLSSLGVGRGDRVLIYMPMVPEAPIAMLACARVGAVHCVVFGGFAAPELATRIDDAEPTVVVTASCGIEPSRTIEYGPLLRAALSLALHVPDHLVMLQRDHCRAAEVTGEDVDWAAAMSGASRTACTPVAAEDALYLLYTSGTTGKPKAIVRDNAGHAVALRWSMTNIFGIAAGDVWWAASDVGWVVGHSYIVYAPLLTGATTVLYEGKSIGTPDAGAFWRVIAEHGVTALFCAPTALRAIKREDPDGDLLAGSDLSSLRALFQAGERLDPETYRWASDHLAVPVIDNWWQTETGWPIAANPRGMTDSLPLKPGSPSVPMPGYELGVLGAAGESLPAGVEGDICIRLPLPPGALVTIWGDRDRFERDYLAQHPGWYTTGDGGFIDEDGYVHVMGRTDDVINVAGHRLSTGAMEAVISGHPAVAECAVVAVSDELKGHIPRAFIVLKRGVHDEPEVASQVITRVRESIGAVASLRQVDVVEALPKTRSGKILRRSIRSIAEGVAEPAPSTIEDPGVLDALRSALNRHV
jgi:propionyl-CoA synthetase